jgi:hypothetical protein
MTHTTPILVLILRWIARVWSIASVLLLAAFAFGGGEDSIFRTLPTLREAVALALFPLGVAIGLLIATFSRNGRREGLGGIIALLSLAAFYAWMFVQSGRVPGGPYFAIFAAPGALFLAAWLLNGGLRSGYTAPNVADDLA